MMRVCVLLAYVAALAALPACSNPDSPPTSTMASAPTPYVPQARFCAVTPAGPAGASPLCPVVPGDIGPDPALGHAEGYKGISTSNPTSAANDAQTPFDNLSWQTFVALNWTKGEIDRPAQEGLQADGPRVWEGWSRVSDLFGNAPTLANCTVPEGLTAFAIGSDGQGHPDGHNEEYIQAATGDPAIDVSGNWTIYERRLNGVETAYLKAPNGRASWTLTSLAGQQQLIAQGGTVNFPALGDTSAPTGAMEIKAAWRVLDPAQRAQNAKRFYVVSAFLTVAPDLVSQGTSAKAAPICAKVDLGLVAMHIIQKNRVTKNVLFPQWFWSTFEHVDNVPLADAACDPRSPATCQLINKMSCAAVVPVNPPDYSYFNVACPECPTNLPPTPAASGPQFAWNPTPPYAGGYLTDASRFGGQKVMVGTQISRCWQNYYLTDSLNTQWRAQLASIDSVFQNYMLIGTQWGGLVEPGPPAPIPPQVVPAYLSNSVVETYLQTSFSSTDPFNNGSCITCHITATLPADPSTKATSNLSFVPGLAQPVLLRRPPTLTPSGERRRPD